MVEAVQIFLSYAQVDRETVERLYHRLSQEGFKPWMDTRDLFPGERWRSSIPRAIRSSDFFLVCLSANSIDRRGFFQREIREALEIWQEKSERDIYLIPVRLEDCEALESLRDFQWVDLFEDDGWALLVKAIREGMKRRRRTIEPTVRESTPTEPDPVPETASSGEEVAASEDPEREQREGEEEQEHPIKPDDRPERNTAQGIFCPQLLKKYPIKRKLGEGGGGRVYLARDEGLGRYVALKHRKVLTADDQHRAERLLQEARTVANLRHPNVAVVHTTERYPESGDYCVVMEYADGGTLGDLLKTEGRLSLERALDIGIEVCTALEYVHRQGLVHGDIKPSNILFFRADDHVDTKVADFGLSQNVLVGDSQREDRDGTFSGTLEYAAPELLGGERIDKRVDLYSLGAVLYHMLTGEPPFPFSGDVAAVIAGHVHGDLTQPQGVRPAVFHELNELNLKALAKAPVERFQDAETMLAALQEVRELCTQHHSQAEKLYRRAVRFGRQKKWLDTVESFDQAHILNPELRDVEQRLANARLQLELETTWHEMEKLLTEGAWADGLEKLGRIGKLAPAYRAREVKEKAAYAQLQLELASRYGEARAAEGAGQRAEAIRLYVEIVSKDVSYRDAAQRLARLRTEDDLEKMWGKGERLVQKEKWEEAIKTYEQMLEKDPNYAGAARQLSYAQRKLELAQLYERALAELKEENWDRATKTLEDITRLEPGYKDAAFQLAKVSRRQQLTQRRQSIKRAMEAHQWSEAERLLEELLRWEPGDSEAQQKREHVQQWQKFEDLYRRGRADDEARQWDEAISKLEAALEVAGSADLDLQNYPDVESLLNQVKANLQLDVLQEEAKQHESAEDFDALVQAFDQILELYPANQEVRKRKRSAQQQVYLKNLYDDACAKLEQEDWDGAKRLLDGIARIDDHYRDVPEKLAQAAVNLGTSVVPSVQVAGMESTEGSPMMSPKGQEFNWMTNSVVAILVGVLCTFLITQLAREILASLDYTRRILSIVFLLCVLVPLSCVIQWRLAQRRSARDSLSTDQ